MNGQNKEKFQKIVHALDNFMVEINLMDDFEMQVSSDVFRVINKATGEVEAEYKAPMNTVIKT